MKDANIAPPDRPGPLTEADAKVEDEALRKALQTLKEEGALHTAMAVQGLNKLPPWKDKGFRGEALDRAEFAKRFKRVGQRGDQEQFTAKEPVRVRPSISSQSKVRDKAEYFMTNLARPELVGKKRWATFTVVEVTVHGSVPGNGYLEVQCTQTR